MKKLEDLPELLTVEETRQVLGVKTIQTVYRKIYRGEISAVKVGRMVRVSKQEILSLISETTKEKRSILKEGNPSRLSPAPQRRRKLEWEV